MEKEAISPLQLVFLIANLLLTATLITLPQVITQFSKQNMWMTPLLVFPIVLGLIVIALGRGEGISEVLKNPKSKITKLFYIASFLYLVPLYIRDLRAFTDFIGANLLPKTPIEVITILLTFTILYISLSGLEVISRITLIQFVVFGCIVLTSPFLLLNEITLANFSPVFGPGVLKELSSSSLIMLPWMGEVVIIFLILSSVSVKKGVTKSVLYGTTLGFLTFFVLVVMDIAVLSANIVSKATYPNFIMIQEINLTDFLDRLDLVIVIVWMPCLIAKIALTGYCIHQVMLRLKITETNLLFPPFLLLLGILSIILFKTNKDHLEFSFYTWTFIGLVLELVIVFLFYALRRKAKREKQNQQA